MGLVIRWGTDSLFAEIGPGGELNFSCPFCDGRTFIRKGEFVVSGEQVRTIRIVMCTYEGCGIPYEIVHSYVVPVELMGCDNWLRFTQWSRPEKLRGVWKSHNERRKRDT